MSSSCSNHAASGWAGSDGEFASRSMVSAPVPALINASHGMVAAESETKAFDI